MLVFLTVIEASETTSMSLIFQKGAARNHTCKVLTRGTRVGHSLSLTVNGAELFMPGNTKAALILIFDLTCFQKGEQISTHAEKIT